MADREKVIKGLEILMNGCEYIDCDDCCFYISTKPTRCGLREEQIQEEALSLLKEQEPVKPYFVNTNYEQHFKCGNCDYVVGTQFKYCCKCGKRILWRCSEQADSGANEKRIRSRRKKRYPAYEIQKEGQEPYEDA